LHKRGYEMGSILWNLVWS